jgi:hypothetical protein
MARRLMVLTFILIILVSLTGCDKPQSVLLGGVSAEPPSNGDINQSQNVDNPEGGVDNEGQQLPSHESNGPSDEKPTLDDADLVPSGNETHYTPTPDNRLTPEDWRNWPVVPAISAKTIDIYQKGLTMGQNPHAVSKTGDCQAIKEVLLGIYDQPERYILSSEEMYLQETIDNYSGSFNRDGMAVKGGFNAASVLSPMWADPDYCEPGETPLACELRVHNPSIMIISLEVWWEGRTVERYEDYMRRIIEEVLDQGVVPVLSTKADNMEGDHSINLATARLAYEYDLPLWNFWLAVQQLPYQGIDPGRDGFHITTEAWNVRSFTALQVIDAVWRAGQDIPATGELIAEAGPIPTPDATFTVEVPSLVSLPSHGEVDLESVSETGKIIFDLSIRDEASSRSLGVFAADFENNNYYNLASAGNLLEAVSPKGDQMIVSRSGSLYLITNDRGDTFKLASADPSFGMPTAYWLRDGGSIVLLGVHEGSYGIWIVSADGLEWANLPTGDLTPLSLFPAPAEYKVYWSGSMCDNGLSCTPDKNQVTNISSGITTDFGFHNPIFSNSGEYFAFEDSIDIETVGVWIAEIEQGPGRFIPLPGDHLLGVKWSPDGEQLAAITLVRSDYSGRPSDVRIFLLNPETFVQREMNPVTGLNAQIAWSNEGDRILISSTSQRDMDTYGIDFWVIDLEKNRTANLADMIQITSQEFISIEHIDWVP